MAGSVFIRMVFLNDSLYVAAETIHIIGISALIYKLMTEKTCAGLSLKSLQLTAIFLAVRLCCSFVMGYEIHMLFDSAALLTTLWVIYMICFRLRSSYMDDIDIFSIYRVLIPCGVLALVIHPTMQHHIFHRICWAFCVFLEVASMLSQLRIMQKTKIVEPFAHHLFALGFARFLSIAYWIFQMYILPQIPPHSATSTYVFSPETDLTIFIVTCSIVCCILALAPAPRRLTTTVAVVDATLSDDAVLDDVDFPRRSTVPPEFRDYIMATLDRTPNYRENIRRRRS